MLLVQRRLKRAGDLSLKHVEVPVAMRVRACACTLCVGHARQLAALLLLLHSAAGATVVTSA
jgi:hypothetical protein